MPRQYVECCLCGHRFKTSTAVHELEKCPKCRSRRLVLRSEFASAPNNVVRQHSEKEKKNIKALTDA